jgi:hypothetical protein
MSKFKNFLDLNKALVDQKIQKLFKIFRHIKSDGTCMKY